MCAGEEDEDESFEDSKKSIVENHESFEDANDFFEDNNEHADIFGGDISGFNLRMECTIYVPREYLNEAVVEMLGEEIAICEVLEDGSGIGSARYKIY